MERNLKWRTLGLLLLIGFCVATILPSVAPSGSLPTWFTRFFHQKVNLGLDLQGGLRIVYGIDLGKAVDDKAFEVKRDLESKFEADGITGTVSTPSTPLGAVTVVIEDAARRAEIAALLKSDYGDVLADRGCGKDDPAGAICVRVSSTYAEGVKRAALRNAVNTIRERIDEKGVAESTVVEKGDDIIVELPGLDQGRIQAVKDIIARTAKLEFKLVIENDPWMVQLYSKVGVKRGRGDDAGTATDPAAAAVGIRADEDLWTPRAAAVTAPTTTCAPPTGRRRSTSSSRATWAATRPTRSSPTAR
ncbi:MAG: hypothetical protein R2939_12985 [Kofleriaceae bacterium]